jgi:MOSC domain-containing protein YiiM
MSAMMVPHVQSVHTGLPKDEAWAGNLKRTAIAKRPLADPVFVARLGLEGDQVADTVHHGGPDKAVYAFAREDLDLWGERLGGRLPDGMFGENLTTVGLDVNEAAVGERWRVGGVLLEVSSVRIPCSVFQNWLGLAGHDASGWIKRFTVEGRPGPYLRVIEEGYLRAGDPIVVESRPTHGITVSMMFRALTTERTLLPDLLPAEALPEDVRRRAEHYLAKASVASTPA